MLASGMEDIVTAGFDYSPLDIGISQDTPNESRGEVALNVWASDLCQRHPHLDEAAIRSAVSKFGEGSLSAHLGAALELASLVASMEMDTASVLAALFHGPVRRGALAKSELNARIGDAAAALAASVIEMADTSILDLTSSRLLASEAKDQTANIRRMLVAVIDDGRVAVLKLAERVVALRRAKASSEERKARIATEAMTVFVPLADRLGIWQLKWELEDLSLRYLEPDAYMRIAKQLDGRRAERERRVNALVGQLREAFESRGIKAGIGGRAKHIYSIWRKMRTKNVPFDEVYDVQAVRIIVGNVAACYAALGIVHALWRPIPDELDDYIAAPKENGYRSIHTAVVGASGMVFEVQIRTEEMHRDAELGVCAHWSYKGMDPEDDYYANKVAWLRQALDAHEREGVGLAGELIDQIREQRVFVYTPKGHVLDLMAGATAVDFAYRVHTEVGQRCVGARIDGVPAPLNTTLQSGQRVRILTDPDAAPQRAWLDPELGYVRTSRAMSKIRAWFYDRDQGENVAAGRSLFLAMIDGLALPLPDPQALLDFAPALKRPGSDGLFFALGVGEMAPLEALRLYLAAHGEDWTQRSLLPEMAAEEGPSRYRLRIEGRDREGLLRDLTETVSRYGLSMLANTGHVEPATGAAWFDVDLELEDLYEAARIMHHLRHVPDVRQVRRVALNAA